MATAPRSFECPRCQRTFSPIISHRTCVVCRDSEGHLLDTFGSERLPIYDATKAAKLKDQYAEFMRRYDKHVERRKKMGYPDPEDVGRMEGRKAAAMLRQLEESFAA